MQRRSAPPQRTSSFSWQHVAVIVAVLVALWAIWQFRAPAVRNLGSKGTNVIAFGDSLTAGFGARAGEDYPTRLSQLAGVPVINAGVSGDTTQSALARIDTDVLARDPRIVIVGLGGNDFLQRVPIATTETNLRTIVQRIEAAGSMVVLLDYRFPFAGEYGRMYGRIAKDEQCLLIKDPLAGILTDPSLKSDEIHPNGRGYDLMAQRIAPPLRKLLARADKAR